MIDTVLVDVAVRNEYEYFAIYMETNKIKNKKAIFPTHSVEDEKRTCAEGKGFIFYSSIV